MESCLRFISVLSCVFVIKMLKMIKLVSARSGQTENNSLFVPSLIFLCVVSPLWELFFLCRHALCDVVVFGFTVRVTKIQREPWTERYWNKNAWLCVYLGVWTLSFFSFWGVFIYLFRMYVHSLRIRPKTEKKINQKRVNSRVWMPDVTSHK